MIKKHSKTALDNEKMKTGKKVLGMFIHQVFYMIYADFF